VTLLTSWLMVWIYAINFMFSERLLAIWSAVGLTASTVSECVAVLRTSPLHADTQSIISCSPSSGIYVHNACGTNSSRFLPSQCYFHLTVFTDGLTQT
jgi:hypothetical protein